LITYKNAAAAITLEDATALYNKGVSVIVSDGKNVTFKAEKEKELYDELKQQ